MGKENSSQSSNSRGEITIDRHYIDSIRTYEITEDQLTMIESGSQVGTSLNFSVASWSVFLAFVVSLVTTDIQGIGKLVFFWVVTAVTFISGLYFTIDWLRGRRSAKSIFSRIRSQKSTNAIRENAHASTPILNASDEQSDVDDQP